MTYFKASVQYGDWHGTAAADDIGPGSRDVRRYLEQKGLVKANEFLIAVRGVTTVYNPFALIVFYRHSGKSMAYVRIMGSQRVE